MRQPQKRDSPPHPRSNSLNRRPWRVKVWTHILTGLQRASNLHSDLSFIVTTRKKKMNRCYLLSNYIFVDLSQEMVYVFYFMFVLN